MAGAAGVRLRPDLVGRLRHRGDRAGAGHRRRPPTWSFAKWVAAVVGAAAGDRGAVLSADLLRLPSGGGAFAVSLDNFGENAALTAAAALLVDYVMTVAVSVVSGVVAHHQRRSPSLHRYAVELSVGVHRAVDAGQPARRARNPGGPSPIPTYTFVALTYLMFLSAAIKAATGQLPDAATAIQQLQRTGPRRRALHAAARPARVRLRMHRADRCRGDQQRRALVPQAEGPQRGEHADHDGAARGEHVRRHHRARPTPSTLAPSPAATRR